MSKAKGGFDLAVASALIEKEEEGITFEVVGPDGKPLPKYKGKPVTMTVCGSYSPTYQRLDEEFGRNWLAEQLEGVPERDRAAAIDDAWARRTQAHNELVRAPCIRGWYGILDGGSEIEVSPETVVKVALIPWVTPQIRAAQEKHEGFFTDASGD